MELKKKYIGSKVFISKLGMEIEIKEENKAILIQHNKRDFFVSKTPVKIIPRKAVPTLDPLHIDVEKTPEEHLKELIEKGEVTKSGNWYIYKTKKYNGKKKILEALN